jgi:hypothetical protein
MTYSKIPGPDDPDAVAVVDLYVQCSFQLYNFDRPGRAASDNCRQPAESAVEYPEGSLMWRCHGHRGQRWADGVSELDGFPFPPGTGRFGSVREYVIIRSS